MSIRLPLSRFPSRFSGSGSARVGGAPAVLDPPSFPTPRPDLEAWREPAPSPPPAPEPETPVAGAPPVAVAKPKPARLVSLDAFRGLTIAGMLLVNNISLGAHTPAQLLHADWSGAVHMADLVFPWFLFIVGVAVPYSQASARRRHLDAWQYDLKALWRAAMLVFLGCLIDSFLAHKPVFDLGVLQLIGLGYFVAVLVGGLMNLPGRLLMSAALLAGHWAILKFTPQPGVAPGTFTEQNNAIQLINDHYLAAYHLNGLVSVLPATAMVLIGTAVGDLLRRKKIQSIAKVGVLTICGAGLASAGYIWSHRAISPWELPMNKPCWTGSYILFCAGLACVGLGLMYLLIDVLPAKVGRWLAFPFIVFGSNAIVAYVVPILTKVAILRNITTLWPSGKPMNLEDGIHQWFYNSFGRLNGGWAYTFAYIAVWWCVLLFLNRKRWYLRV